MHTPVYGPTFFYVSLAAISLCAPQRLDAAASVLKKGESFYSANFGYTTATRFWDRERNLQRIGCHRQTSDFSHHYEYGHSQYSTWFGDAILATTNCDDDGASGFNDFNLGFRNLIRRDEDSSSAVTITATLPADDDRREDTGQSRLSCGVFGLSAQVERQDQLNERASIAFGGGLQFFESPLAHQLALRTSFNGLLSERWAFNLGLAGRGPITQQPSPDDPLAFRNAAIASCGTQAKSLSGTLGLSRLISKAASISCGASSTLRGEGVSKSHGLFCGYSFSWK